MEHWYVVTIGSGLRQPNENGYCDCRRQAVEGIQTVVTNWDCWERRSVWKSAIRLLTAIERLRSFEEPDRGQYRICNAYGVMLLHLNVNIHLEIKPSTKMIDWTEEHSDRLSSSIMIVDCFIISLLGKLTGIKSLISAFHIRNSFLLLRHVILRQWRGGYKKNTFCVTVDEIETDQFESSQWKELLFQLCSFGYLPENSHAITTV